MVRESDNDYSDGGGAPPLSESKSSANKEK